MAVAWVQNQADVGLSGIFTGSNTTQFVTLTNGVTATNGLGGILQTQSGQPALSSVIDNQSNHWSIFGPSGSSGTYFFGIATCPGTAPSGVTFTWASAPTNGTGFFCIIDEISGAVAINGNGHLNTASGATTYSTTVVSTLTSLLYGTSDIFTTGTITAGTGTLHSNGTGASGFSSSSQANVSAGTNTVTFNCSVADPFTCDVCVLAFTALTAAATFIPPRRLVRAYSLSANIKH